MQRQPAADDFPGRGDAGARADGWRVGRYGGGVEPNDPPSPAYDAIIVGGGPAGLSAALILGRCRRRVLLLDAAHPRNGASQALHGYLTRDGVNPWELRQKGREELFAYGTVEFDEGLVVEIGREGGGFGVVTIGGRRARAAFVLLATGRSDPIPEVAGFEAYYGRGVFHCPYCDGWENRDKRLVVYGGGQSAADLALELLTWSADVTICTGGSPLAAGVLLERVGIRVIAAPVAELQGASDRPSRLVFSDGASPLPCDAVFFCTECVQRSALPERLGCTFDEDGSVVCDSNQARGVPGLYVAGNVRGGVHLAITAAAEGAEAALAINEALIDKACR